MPNDIVMVKDLASSATITQTNPDTDYPKENLVDNSPSVLCKSDNVSTTFLFDFGSAVTVKEFAWHASNMVVGDTTFTIQAGDAPAAGDDGPLDCDKATRGHLLLNSTTGWIRRYFLVTVLKLAGVAEFGSMNFYNFFDQYIRNYRRGNPAGVLGNYNNRSGRYGQKWDKLRYQNYSKTMHFRMVTTAQKNIFNDPDNPDDCIETNKFVTIYDDERGRVYFGTMEVGPTDDHDGRWDYTAIFDEVK